MLIQIIGEIKNSGAQVQVKTVPKDLKMLLAMQFARVSQVASSVYGLLLSSSSLTFLYISMLTPCCQICAMVSDCSLGKVAKRQVEFWPSH